jgi:hypothetical protein
MKFTKDELEALREIVKKELENFQEDSDEITMGPPQWFALEEKYEVFLEKLLKKLK